MIIGVDTAEAVPAAQALDAPSPAGILASDFLPPTNWPTPQATLAEICLCLTELVPLAESAGVVVLPPAPQQNGQRKTLDGAEVIGAARAGEAVLEIERQLHEGPILTACDVETIVTSGDLGNDERWRRFGPAVADLQLRSALAMPLPGSNGATRAVLCLYSPKRNAFDMGTIHVIAAVGNVVRNALLVAELLEQTRRAFEAMDEALYRERIVNQAVGVLISLNCSEDQALSRLVRMASRSNEDLATTARAIVEEASKEARLSFITAARSSRSS